MAAKAAPPTHRVYTVKDGKADKKAFWTRIGSAWPHKNGTGFTIRLDALPLNGELVMIDVSEEPEDTAQH